VAPPGPPTATSHEQQREHEQDAGDDTGGQRRTAAAREVGAEIRTGTPVTDVRRETGGGAVVGVETDSGRIDADFVVNAAGPWARRVNRMAGVDLPIAPRRRQLVVVDPEQPVPEDVPLTIDLDTGSYFRPEREGAALVGGHFSSEAHSASGNASGEQPRARDPGEDPDRYDDDLDIDWAVEAAERAGEYTTYFGAETRIRRGWACLYAVTPDHHPVVEEVVPGYVVAAGFSGHGFQHAPATGQVVAQLALDGGASLVDVSPLSSDRFADGEGPDERNVV